MLIRKDEYLIGVEEIDKQHEKLFEIGSRAFDLFKKVELSIFNVYHYFITLKSNELAYLFLS